MAIFSLIVTEDTKTILISLLTILFFGCGSIIAYILDTKEKESNVRTIALLFGCLIFIVGSYSVLPFNHLFDNSHKYTPTLGWIIGIVGILFFGYGFIVSAKKMITKGKNK